MAGDVEAAQPLYTMTTRSTLPGSVSTQVSERPVVVDVTGSGALVRSRQVRPASSLRQMRPVEVTA